MRGTKQAPMRIVRDGIWTPILASDLEIGDLVNCQPDALHNPERYGIDPSEVEGVNLQIHKSKASLILLRMNPGDIKPGKAADGSSRASSPAAACATAASVADPVTGAAVVGAIIPPR